MALIEVTAKINIDQSFLDQLHEAATQALEITGDQVLSDLHLSGTMPKETGTLEDVLTSVDYSKASQGEITIVSEGPYARRLYFHPEYHFRRDKNPNAGGRWLDPYLSGHEKGDFAANTFAKILAQRLELIK